MEHVHFDVERDGFYGAYWSCPSGASCALIAMLGVDHRDARADGGVDVSGADADHRHDGE